MLGPDKALKLVMPACLTTDPVVARVAGRWAISIYLGLPAYHRLWASHGFEPSDWSDGGSDRLVDACLNWGDLDTILARVEEFRAAGVTRVLVAASPSGVSGSEWELIEALAPTA